ncbi:hypothetical protein AQV86_04285 [Nanohaloarchaea archaeon SG9]|nr:hypothetical protein AQV86_04285 [Nanohaloarchaea archaeon SG9]
MTNLLSPERSRQELEGGLELEELADRLEGEEIDEVEGFDLVYSKDRRESSESHGSTYRLQETGTDWYEDENLEKIEVEGLEIDIQEVRMNSVTGETVLIDSDGKESRYDIRSSFEGSTTFTQEVGRNTYVFRYDKNDEDVRAIEVGGEMEPSYWGSSDLEKRAELMDKLYHETREQLWKEKTTEEDIETKDSKFEKLRPYYNAVTSRIDQDGRAIIKENTHIGSARGGHIKRNFKKAVKRAPNDSLDNYTIENDGSEYPIIIEEN